MNAIFSIITLISLITITIVEPTKTLTVLTTGGMNGVNFAIKIFTVYAIWTSILNVWEKLKLTDFLSKKTFKLVSKIFPNENANTYKNLSLNLSANLLGMGNAGTPSGIDATASMKSKKNRIMLLVINSTSIQLIPTTIVALRSTFSSATDIILPTLISTTVSTLCGIILVKVFVK